MALVKNPKAALAKARAAKAKRSKAPKPRKIVPVGRTKQLVAATASAKCDPKPSPLDFWVPGGSAGKRGTVQAPRMTNVRSVRSVDVPPHGLTGNIPLGHRSAAYDEPIQVLQVSEDFCGAQDAERFVARMLIDEFRQRNARRDEGDEWFAWIGTVTYQPAGLIFWIGLSENVPPAAFGALDDVISAMGFPTARATAIPAKHDLAPLLYLGDDGLELLRMI